LISENILERRALELLAALEADEVLLVLLETVPAHAVLFAFAPI
jgi:hypothetical protein